MFRALYNLSISLFVALLYVVQLFNAKVRKMVVGRSGQDFRDTSGVARETICIHCASLGEFEQGRSLIEALRTKYPNARLVLTFFSPSGYDIRRDYEGVDAVYYLPFDRPVAMRRFVEALSPSQFYIIKYEYWYNLLRELNRYGCELYLVSAIFRKNSVFFKSPWRGGAFYRGMLSYFTALFVQDEYSSELLGGLGYADKTVVVGDTRFDRVASVVGSARRIELVERFAQGSPLTIICGSSWDADEELLCEVMARREQWRFVVVPHEISESRIVKLIKNSGRIASRYSQGVIAEGSTLLVVDTIGLLSSLYGYGQIAYIGGGFGAGIHNTLEAATWGVPIVFGAKYHKFREARDLISLGAASSVSNGEEMLVAFDSYAQDGAQDGAQNGAHAGALAKEYVAINTGATGKIISYIGAALKS